MKQFDFVRKQQNLRSVICCPSCHNGVNELDASVLGGFVLSANLHCSSCGIIGHVCNGRYVFGSRPLVRWGRRFQSDNHLSIVQRSLDRIHADAGSGWQLTPTFVWTGDAGDISLETSAVGLNVDFLSHSWAGLVDIFIDEERVLTLDLFEPNGSSRVSVPLFLGQGSHRVRVCASGRKNVGSSAPQCHVLGVQELVESPAPVDLGPVLTGNRGNPYPAVWADILEAAPQDAFILDCGSGDRCYPDDRVINFEYCPFGLPDIYGDGHAIPFKTDSFDVILSQAVFEHLYDPKKAASEIERILKPGGLVYVESAFMQPLHAVPFHFFNTTPWGLEKLFENLDHCEVKSHGTLGQTLSWIYSLCDIESRGGKPKLDQLLSLATELDGLITPDEMRKFSSFVSLSARKKLSEAGISA